SICRHFLLMTATPHNGKEEDFQVWMSLLDSDRFYGKFREGAHKVDITDMMRRMVKEELLTFDGTPLFPERRAYTANYELSPLEASLYEQVTTYVREEMNRADKLDNKKKNTVGFALTQLQRRLASSPEAIYQSLKRRRNRLKDKLDEMKLMARGQKAKRSGEAETLEKYKVSKSIVLPDDWDELDEDLSAEEYELYSEEVADQATAAETIFELEAEINSLRELENQALVLVQSGNDKKWEELS
ncbi:TPA: RNA helicase, partial [Klebsiella pneumoniae]|nr:RNA helicase [Klebsiella pneumoniae]